ncbi:MAG TPA: rhomboid family intramembrane serine protease [Mycobacteriales bacterium]|nr:rhomboid family intramembrane serine protease [Mycobacteriales bacterium]
MVTEAPEHCYRHPATETSVHCTRCDRPICPKCMIPAAVGFHCPECVTEGRRTTRTARTIYGGRIRPGETPGMVTRTLIAINVVVFIIACADGANVLTGSGSSSLFRHLALIPPAVGNGEWWRLFTAAFLHFGIFHIGFNMYALWIFGPPLEAAMGKVRFVALYLLAGIAGNLLSAGLGPLNETAAGASGAIFGLFAALYVVARHRNFNTQPIAFTIVANLVFTFAVSNIDWRGHVGGLVVGAAIAAIIAFAPRGPHRDRIQAAGILGVCAVMVVGGLLAVHRVNHRCGQVAVAPPTLASGPDLASCIIYDRPAVRNAELNLSR